MQQPAGDTDLSPADRTHVQSVLDRYRKTGNCAGPVDFTGYLPEPGNRLTAATLRELVKCDLLMRWRSGRCVYMEDYLKRHPELGDDSDALVDLLFEEYQVRRRHGDRPSLDGYSDRFPAQFDTLEQKVLARPDLADNRTPIDPRETGALVPVFGGYRLVKRIGRGGYGEVWQAEAPGGVDVAIKVIFRPLHHAVAQRELESLDLVKRLRHPFLLQTQAFWSLEDRLMIVMELADGSLQDRLKACTRAGQSGIPAEELLVYMRETCEALDFLHSKQVLHRDIKPDNLLLLEHHVKVADFGLARLMQAHQARQTIRGTPAFMPPESWVGNATEQSDQYSLAGSYVELRLNRHLFPGDDLAGIRFQHLERAPDLDPLSQPEQQVLLKALAKEPGDRYATCMAFWEALRHSVGPMAGVAPSADAWPDVKPTWRQDGPPSNHGQPITRHANASINLFDTSDPPEIGTLEPPGTRATGLPGLAPPKRRPLWAGGAALAAFALTIAAGLTYWLPRPRTNGIEPPPIVNAYVPDGYRPADGAVPVADGNRTLYDRIERELRGKTEVEFVLIKPNKPTDPPAFYIMRDKVNNHVYGLFAKAKPAEAGELWKQGPAPSNNPNAIGYGAATFPMYPVVRVSVDEANRFAHWLGGQLPTARQWDKAAGRFDDAVGPFQDAELPDAAYGTGQAELLAGNRSPIAESIFKCRDMAGNGYEWTRSTNDDESVPVPFDQPDWNQRVSLRGETYLNKERYVFAKKPPAGDSEYRTADPGPAQRPGAQPDVSFRVVLDLPPAK